MLSIPRILSVVLIVFAFSLACGKPSEAGKLAQNRETWGRLDEREKKLVTDRWLKISSKERTERLQAIESLERRKPKERDRLRRMNARKKHLVDEVIRHLPPEFVARLDARPAEERKAIVHYILGRWYDLTRRRLMDQLSDDELRELRSMRGPEQFRRIQEHKRTHEAEVRKANLAVIEEIAVLDDATLRREVRRFHEKRVRRELSRLGVDDEAADRIISMPPHRAMRQLHRLREIKARSSK